MARSTSRSKAKSTSVKVDFTDVESGGRVAEGRHRLEVSEVPEVKTSDNSGNDYLQWKFKTPEGGLLYHITSLAPQALFNLRNTLEALGVEVEQSTMNLELTEYVGLTCGGEVEHEVYQGKKKARLVDIFPESELEEEESGEPASKGSSKKKPDPEPADDELTADDLKEASKEELLEIAKDNEVDGITVKMKKDLDALRAHIAEALEIELESEEEESEDPTYASVQEMEKEELLALVKEHDIEGVTLKLKKDLDALRDHICEALELEEEEAPAKTSRKKTGSAELKKGTKVTFVDDGEELEGKIVSVNAKEKFAKVDVDGDEWEVELDDLTVA